MLKKRFVILFILLLLPLLLGACSGDRFQATSWPGLAYDPETETIYVAYNRAVYALDVEGDETWRYPEKANTRITFYAPPAIRSEGDVLVGGYDNMLYSLPPQGGAEPNWIFDKARNRYIGAPLALNGTIYAADADYNLYALNGQGEEIWRFKASQPFWASPVSDGKTIFAVSLEGIVYALDAQSGAERWDAPVELGGAVVSAPAISADGVLYIGTFDNKLVALDGNNGRLLWQYDTKGWVWASPALIGETIYTGDLSGALYALSASDGELLWEANLKSPILSTPVLFGELLYVGTEDGDVFSIQPEDGETKKIKLIDGKLYGTPLVVNDLILFGVVGEDDTAIVVALDASGDMEWSFTPAEKK